MSSNDYFNALFRFYSLLKTEVNSEEEYQRLFEECPLILASAGFYNSLSFEKRSRNRLPFDDLRNFRPEPDFIDVDPRSGKLTIIEIKTPFVGPLTTSRSDGNRAKHRANVETYISQVNEYIDSIRERSEAQSVITRIFGTKHISSYNGTLICGFSDTDDRSKLSRIGSRQGISLITFDELFEMTVREFGAARQEGHSQLGWSYSGSFAVRTNQSHDEAYIIYIGSDGKASLSLIYKHKHVIARIIDDEGDIHELKTFVKPDAWIDIIIEASHDKDHRFMTLHMNNSERDLRKSLSIPNSSLNTIDMVIGADNEYKRGCSFQWAGGAVTDKTLSDLDRIQWFHHAVLGRSNAFGVLSFEEDQYMETRWRSERGSASRSPRRASE